MASDDDTQSARKHRAIMQAAAEAFLRNGYLGASMDEVAKVASVSKQTVYKHFSDKEQLFTEIIDSTTDQVVDQLVRAATLTLGDGADLERDLHRLARQVLASIGQPKVVALRRLVIAEAERFPQLGRAYWERGFAPGLAALASGLRQLTERGVLRVDDPDVAAAQFVGMVLWVPMNQVMFCGQDAVSVADGDRYIDAAVRAFLAAYGQPST